MFPNRWCLITPVELFGFGLYRIQRARRLGRGELGHGLGALRDGVLGKLTGEDEADGSLDFARSKSGLLVDASKLSSLGGDLLELVGNEGVEDGHGLGGDTGIGVHLLQHLEDVELVGFNTLLGLLLRGVLLDGLLGSRFLSGGGSHCDGVVGGR